VSSWLFTKTETILIKTRRLHS